MTRMSGWRGMPVDETRAALANGLAVTPVTGGYLVREAYWVQLDDPSAPACDCADHVYRDVLCKHALAAMAYETTRQGAAA